MIGRKSSANGTSREHKAARAERSGKKKNRQTEKRITKASIDSGRRSNDLRQTARESRGGRFPWVKSTYRLRSRRSSEFPVINYGVDDRVPPLFLLLLPLPLAVLFLLTLRLLPRPRSYHFAHPFPSMSVPLLFLLPPETLLAPFFLFFFFIHLTASRKRYAAYRGSVRTTCGPHS